MPGQDVVLGYKVAAAGQELTGSEAIGSPLGICSVRIEKSAATLEGEEPPKRTAAQVPNQTVEIIFLI